MLKIILKILLFFIHSITDLSRHNILHMFSQKQRHGEENNWRNIVHNHIQSEQCFFHICSKIYSQDMQQTTLTTLTLWARSPFYVFCRCLIRVRLLTWCVLHTRKFGTTIFEGVNLPWFRVGRHFWLSALHVSERPLTKWLIFWSGLNHDD
jgi:hypothetical protein